MAGAKDGGRRVPSACLLTLGFCSGLGFWRVPSPLSESRACRAARESGSMSSEESLGTDSSDLNALGNPAHHCIFGIFGLWVAYPVERAVYPATCLKARERRSSGDCSWATNHLSHIQTAVDRRRTLLAYTAPPLAQTLGRQPFYLVRICTSKMYVRCVVDRGGVLL